MRCVLLISLFGVFLMLANATAEGVATTAEEADAQKLPLGDRLPNKLRVVEALQPIKKPQVLWKFNSPSKQKGLSDPAASHGLIFVGDDAGKLFALTAVQGGRLWEYDSKARIFHPPMSDGEVVCFTNQFGVYALDFGTGLQRWFHPLKRQGRPLIANGIVYASDGDGTMHAYDAQSGEEQWATTFADDIPEDPPGFDHKRGGFAGSLARPTGISCDEERIYQSVFDHCRVVSFDRKTGKRGPNFQTAGWIYADAAVDDEFLFVGSQDDHIYCFDKATGKPVWKSSVKGRIESCPAVTASHVFIPSCNGVLNCVDKRAGEHVWRFRIEHENRAIYSAPIVANGIVYFAVGDGIIYAVNEKSGKLEWKIRPSKGSEMYSCLATDGERLFAQCRKDGDAGEDAIYAIGAEETK